MIPPRPPAAVDVRRPAPLEAARAVSIRCPGRVAQAVASRG
jgi:hypothetical protein